MIVMIWFKEIMVWFRQLGLSIAVLLLLFDCIVSLELLELHVPAHVLLGTRAHLSCRWQLGPADVLYSVKWYKDGKEFFRHIPRNAEPWRKFPLPGVDVEVYDFTGANLTLASTTLDTTGRYRCEVSGEKPLFKTVSDHADMTVIVLPDHGPIISGFEHEHSVGSHVFVTCTSGRSTPASRLTWYINGEPAPTTAMIPPIIHAHNNGLLSTSRFLRFVVKEKHFKNNTFKVKCLSTLSSIYWKSSEESAVRGSSKFSYMPAKYMEDMDTKVEKVQANAAYSFNISKICFYLTNTAFWYYMVFKGTILK